MKEEQNIFEARRTEWAWQGTKADPTGKGLKTPRPHINTCKGKSMESDGTGKGKVYLLSTLESPSRIRICFCIGLLLPAADLSHLPAEMRIYLLLSPKLS